MSSTKEDIQKANEPYKRMLNILRSSTKSKLKPRPIPDPGRCTAVAGGQPLSKNKVRFGQQG